MAWDFTVDSDIQLDMAKMLKNKADELDTQFANLYTQIGPSNLGTHWVGSDYDAFNVGCEGYNQALQDMTDSIRMYADHFESVAEGTDALSSMCISIVQNMTTRGDALPGGQLPVAPNMNYPTGGNPTSGTNRFKGGNTQNNTRSGTYTNPSTVYGPPPTSNQNGYINGPSTVYAPPTRGNQNSETQYGGGTSTVYGPPPTPNQDGYISGPSTVYGPPTRGNQNSEIQYGGGTSTVYGPPPTPSQDGYISGPSTVYGPPPTPSQGGYKSGPSTVYAQSQYMDGEKVTVQPQISTVYGPAPVNRGTIIYPDRGSSSSTPISTVYGAPVRGGGSTTTQTISTVYIAPANGEIKKV